MSREQRYAGFLERESHNASTPTKGEAMRQAARLLLENALENERMRREIYTLQEALSFWLSCVPGVHSERDERIANDAGLLAGFDGDIDGTAESRGWISVESNARLDDTAAAIDAARAAKAGDQHG